jgi:signal recognition particle receptor subunit beta
MVHRLLRPDQKGRLISLPTETDRTLFFDFLPVDLGQIKGFKVRFHLYTVPGQVFYNATRRLVLQGVDGVVFVADSQVDMKQSNLESLKNLMENLASYGKKLEELPFVLQFNKRDLRQILPVREMNAQLNPRNVPAVEGIAKEGVGVSETLVRISRMVFSNLRKTLLMPGEAAEPVEMRDVAHRKVRESFPPREPEPLEEISDIEVLPEAQETPEPPPAAVEEPAAPAGGLLEGMNENELEIEVTEPEPAPTAAVGEQAAPGRVLLETMDEIELEVPAPAPAAPAPPEQKPPASARPAPEPPAPEPPVPAPLEAVEEPVARGRGLLEDMDEIEVEIPAPEPPAPRAANAPLEAVEEPVAHGRGLPENMDEIEGEIPAPEPPALRAANAPRAGISLDTEAGGLTFLKFENPYLTPEGNAVLPAVFMDARGDIVRMRIRVTMEEPG